jgi:hypothetical protein
MFEFLKQNIRKTTILLIISVFTLKFSVKISDVVKGKDTCVCSYDGYGYYMYLTQLFQYRNLILQQNESQEVQDKYCNGNYVYQLKRMDNGNNLDIYHMGQAYLELPAYAVGHVFAKCLGYPKDGFSKPYHITFLLNALLFILLGIYFLNKILKLFFSDQVSALLLLIIYFGTNFWITAIYAYQLQHIYLFALIGMLFYSLLKLRALPSKRKYLIVAALTLGLISAIRPTHVLLGFLPLFLLRGIYPTKAAYWKSMVLFPIAGFLVNLPQLIYWKVLGGSWFILNMHMEEVIIVDPHLFDFLFSYKKGWLLYTPIFLLLVPGFIQLYKQRKELFWGIFTSFVFCVWIFCSWECWWYAASFGSRAMVDLYPLLAVPVGFAIVYLGRTRITAFLMMGFVFLTLGLSVFQSEQFTLGYLHTDRMTREHYWYIFGKLDIPDYETTRLEIDRSNTNWPEEMEAAKIDFAKVDKIDFCEITNVTIPSSARILIDKRPYYPKLKTDETLFEVQVIYQNKDSLNPGILFLETFSKYNTYNWKVYPLVTQKRMGISDTLNVRYNLPVINHNDDKIQIYMVNPGKKGVIIHSLKIKALSLIRK